MAISDDNRYNQIGENVKRLQQESFVILESTNRLITLLQDHATQPDRERTAEQILKMKMQIVKKNLKIKN
jgi:hypothetical protein